MFEWLQNLADYIVIDFFGMDATSHLAEALNFFIYDSIKILILLFIIIFFMGIINSYFPIERVKNYLSRNKLYGLEYLMASLFGTVTPFCSCSSVPLFIGFVSGGIPLGVTFAKQYNVRSIPTQVFLDENGNEYFRHEGYFPEKELIEVLKRKGVH